MNIQIDISEIRQLLDDVEKISLAYTDPAHIFQWYCPSMVTGIDKEKVIAFNRVNNYPDYFQSLFQPQLENHPVTKQHDELDIDDQIIAEYLQECISQRNIHQNKLSDKDKLSDQKIISPVQHIEALCYLALEFETKPNFSEIDRHALSLEQLHIALDVLTKAITSTKQKHVKESLIDFAYFLFCYKYVSPELSSLPNIQQFLETPENTAKLDALYDI